MGKHIILIEDDPDILETTKLLLEHEGYRVTAFGAFTNLEEMNALNADCFLLDENLPVLSGHIICILLKSKPATRNIPVVLISANPNIGHLASLGEADACVKKPFEMHELLSALNGVIGEQASSNRP